MLLPLRKLKQTRRRRKYPPVHSCEDEQIAFAHSVFIIVYWRTTKYGSFANHIVRKRPGKSGQRIASPMVYSHVGHAERTASVLNAKYGTTNFIVRRVRYLCTPYYEPWRIKRKESERRWKAKRAVRRAAIRHEHAVKRKERRTVAMAAYKAAQRDYERNPIAYEYYKMSDDYEPVAYLHNKKPTKYRRKKPK